MTEFSGIFQICKRKQQSFFYLDEIWKLLDYLLWRHQDEPDTLIEWLKEVASAGQGFQLKFMEGQYKGVCGKEIKQREPVYKCNTCAADNTCIQCVFCYQVKSSLHTHNICHKCKKR